MLNLHLLRNDPNTVAARLNTRGYSLETSLFKDLEMQCRTLQTKTQALQAERNKLSREIGQQKKQGLETSALVRKVERVNGKIEQLEKELGTSQEALENWLYSIPNLPHESVPIGMDETNNILLKTHGQPRTFQFLPQEQVKLGQGLGLDIPISTKLSGSRFSVLKGPLARLHRALAQCMLDLHTQVHGYTEYYTPYIVNANVLYGTGQLPKFTEDMYRVISGDPAARNSQEQYLISTAEITLTNLFREKILDEAELPYRLTAHTPCFRSEAGSYGKDTKGLLRQHQFDKVELVHITRPEDSYETLEVLRTHAEAVLQLLELPYRVMTLCTGDMGFSAAKTYDLEVWIPSEKTYREISSCSNCEDFQARRMKARFRDQQGKNRFVHTLNGSGVAVGRALVALLENHQNSDGSIYIPEKLRPYLDGLSQLTPLHSTT
ncbi:MAG: serine--tRNA ligase [Neisseriaceae bacterium]